MGYTTDFFGKFDIDRKLKEEHARYLFAFQNVRHMRRDEKIASKMSDPVREATGLPIGNEAAYFVGGDEGMDASILNYNEPPRGQPGFWCNWTPSIDGKAILWNEREKFYNYVDWLTYLMFHFLNTWGYVLNGEVEWQGEDRDDFGLIVVANSKVTIRIGSRQFG